MIAPDGYHPVIISSTHAKNQKPGGTLSRRRGSREGELVGQSLQVYTIMTTGLKDLKEKITTMKKWKMKKNKREILKVEKK